MHVFCFGQMFTPCMGHMQVKSDVDDILNAFCTSDKFIDSEEVCISRSCV